MQGMGGLQVQRRQRLRTQVRRLPDRHRGQRHHRRGTQHAVGTALEDVRMVRWGVGGQLTSVAWHHAQAIDRADLHQGRRLHAANVQPPGPAERRHNGQRHHRHKGKPDAGAEAVSYSVHSCESTDVSGIPAFEIL